MQKGETGLFDSQRETFEPYREDPKFGSHLLPLEEFAPMPRAQDRRFWESRPEEFVSAARAAADEYRGVRWSVLPPSMYLEFFRSGDRASFEALYHPRRRALAALTLSACITGDGTYLEDLLDTIWAICEESTWVLPAHIGVYEHPGLPRPGGEYIDILAARTAADLAWCRYLLATQLDDIDPAVVARIDSELRHRIIEPYVKHVDFWWMNIKRLRQGAGYFPVNNWNPWCNLGCLTAALFCDIPSGLRLEAIKRCMESVDVFIQHYGLDGGCEEGPSYWAHAAGSLFQILDLIHALTQGRVDLYESERIRNMGRFPMIAHISGSHYVNFADCVPKIEIDAGLVFQIGQQIGDENLSSFSRYLWKQHPRVIREDLSRSLLLARSFPGIEQGPDAPRFRRVAFFRKTQQMYAREFDGSDKGLFLAVRGGHNDESHSHNDVGSFLLYRDGIPVIIDPGVETYRRETFSNKRYTIWTMQSGYHNLPKIDDFEQFSSPDAGARRVQFSDNGESAFQADIAPAYPPEAKIQSWQRELRFVRKGASATVILRDRFRVDQAGRRLAWHFMLAHPPKVLEKGRIVLYGDGDRTITLVSSNTDIGATTQTIKLTDKKMTEAWGPSIYRLVLEWAKAPESGQLEFRFS